MHRPASTRHEHRRLTAYLLLLLVALLLLSWSGAVRSAFASDDVTAAPSDEVASTADAPESVAADIGQAAEPLDQQAELHTECAEDAAVDEFKPVASTEAEEKEDHSAALDDLSDEELKALLSDKKKGQVNLKRYKSRDDLVKAIREAEKKEAAQRDFRNEVAAAAQWYTETQDEQRYQRAAARRAKSSRIKHGGDVPAALRHGKEGSEEQRYELRVLYSEASSYGKHFSALVKDLEIGEGTRLPNLNAFRVVGEPYPVSTESAVLSQVLQVAFYGVMALAIVPDMVPFIPEAGRNMLRSRRGLVISTAFMLNMFGRSLLQTNAFEVYFDGEVIYSTIKMGGRLPTSAMVSKMLLERTLLKEYAAAMGKEAAAALL